MSGLQKFINNKCKFQINSVFSKSNITTAGDFADFNLPSCQQLPIVYLGANKAARNQKQQSQEKQHFHKIQFESLPSNFLLTNCLTGIETQIGCFLV